MSGVVQVGDKVFEGRMMALLMANSKDVKHAEFNNDCFALKYDDGQKSPGFRLVFMVEKKAWDKKLIVLNEDGSKYAELVCGDNYGNQHKDDQGTRYVKKRINWTGNQMLHIVFEKPKAFGAYERLIGFSIPVANRKLLDGKTLVFYWQDDDSGKFVGVDNKYLPKPYPTM
eukprot:gene8578-10556_t